ncbi:unnamed protein product [Polarella glacialis]|uniref:ATP-dependent DNA helicase n=1 Tax=Polarella glacialis TaxID=89957 RepID=A0A813J1R3_POLGL|nr:unnamed protein product [Polarella glacialis]
MRGLSRDRKKAVALFALAMQKEWESRPDKTQHLLSRSGCKCRALIVGSGGCGKTRIINYVLKPLFAKFYGREGVLTQGPSNKAARLIKGKTMRSANKLMATSSLRTVHLRLKPSERAALQQITEPLGALLLDEFSQMQGQLVHADHTADREHTTSMYLSMQSPSRPSVAFHM